MAEAGDESASSSREGEAPSSPGLRHCKPIHFATPMVKNLRLSEPVCIAEELLVNSGFSLEESIREAEAMERVYGGEWVWVHLRKTWMATTWDPTVECSPFDAEAILAAPETHLVERVPKGSCLVLGKHISGLLSVWERILEPWVTKNTKYFAYGWKSPVATNPRPTPTAAPTRGH